MKVLLANPRGFCAGVNMAIEALDRALELYEPPIYVFHEIVHNRHVVERFRRRGVSFVDGVEEVPQGALLMYSAHGVSPEVRQQVKDRRIRSIDATCPLVTKVHLEAIKFARAGYSIFLIGHKGHDEVVGTMGEVPQSIELVQSVSDVEKLSVPTGAKVAYLTQTTLSVDDAKIIIEALKRKFPEIQGPQKDDICYATQNRQEAIRELAQEADLVLVLGSQNSSNSLRLVEIARICGKPAYLIDEAKDIDPVWLKGVETVLISAGASAPEWVVEQCVQHLESRFDASTEERMIRREDVKFALPKELRLEN